MSMDEARQTLGFPSGYVPSPDEISKAYKGKAKRHHPDHGGDHQAMVEINVAKEVLLGKARPTAPRSSPSKSPEEARREEEATRRVVALHVIDTHSAIVGKAVASAFKVLDLQGWKIDISEFVTDELIPALDQIQDMIDDSEAKSHPDMRKADGLCASLSNKAMRVSKRYKAFQARVEKEQKAGEVTYSKMVTLYAEAKKFIAGFTDLYQESRNLRGLISTSEHVPFEWDDIYSRPHSVIAAFATSSSSGYKVEGYSLESYEKAALEAVNAIGSVLTLIDPDAWKKAPAANDWKYPEDFAWARDAVK